MRTYSRPADPVPISDSAWTAGTADFAAFKAKYPGAPCEPAGFERPSAQPAFRAFRWDDEGRLWVEARTADGYRFDLFGPDGGFLGSVPAPDRDDEVPWYVRAGRLHTVRTDEDGTQAVVIHAVRIP